METFFIITLATGLILFLTSIFLSKYPPKKLNDWYGYRTPQSQSSQEKWDFAQLYSAKLMKISGCLLILVSPLSFLVKMDPGTDTIVALCLTMAATFIPIVMTETRLKNL